MHSTSNGSTPRQLPGGQPKAPFAINAPRVVLVLFALMLLMQVIMSFASEQTIECLLLYFALIPARYHPALSFIYPGGMYAGIWTFVTYLFLHGGWLHLGINAFIMLAFGSVLARRFGAMRFLLFSMLAGIGAGAVHLWSYWGDQAPLIGASGAISGQIAGTVRLMFGRGGPMGAVRLSNRPEIRAQSLLEVFTNPRALAFLAIWNGVTVIAGMGGVMAPEGANIAWEAHLGGFVTGMLLFGLFDRSTGFWGGGHSDVQG